MDGPKLNKRFSSPLADAVINVKKKTYKNRYYRNAITYIFVYTIQKFIKGYNNATFAIKINL